MSDSTPCQTVLSCLVAGRTLADKTAGWHDSVINLVSFHQRAFRTNSMQGAPIPTFRGDCKVACIRAGPAKWRRVPWHVPDERSRRSLLTRVQVSKAQE